MKFTIEQIAICPKNPIAAKKLLTEIGAVDWVEDHVVATGLVYDEHGMNEADLSFNYDIFAGKEFEILNYTSGRNWVDETTTNRNVVSHLGMHCTADELLKWRKFFRDRGIQIAQEVFTDSHSNPAIAGTRSYNYVIFDTRKILGVDLKFIVRIEVNDSV